MASAISCGLCSSAAVSSVGPISAAATQGSQRLPCTASRSASAWDAPHPTGATFAHESRTYDPTRVPISDAMVAWNAGESRIVGESSSGSPLVSAPSALMTGSTFGASASTQASQ